MGKHQFEGGWAYNGLLFFLELVVQVGSGQGLGEAGRTGPGRQFGGGSYVGWERWRWDRRGTGRVVDGALVRGEDVVCRGRGGNRRRKHLLRGNTTHGGGLSLSCEVVRRWGDRVEMGHAGGGGTLGVAVGGEAGHGICGRHWSWRRRVGQKQTAASMRPMMRPGMGVPRVVSVVGCGMSVVGCRLSPVGWLLTAASCPLNAMPWSHSHSGRWRWKVVPLRASPHPLTPHQQCQGWVLRGCRRNSATGNRTNELTVRSVWA